MKFKIISLYIIAFLIFTSCTVNVNQSYTNKNLNVNKAISQNENEIVLDKEDKQIWFEGNYLETDSLKLNGYLTEKVKVKKYYEKLNEYIDVVNAVITKNGKQIAKFDGVVTPLGNRIDFALFSFFDQPNEQLVIVDSTNRYEEVWIVDLSKDFKVLFNSSDYGIVSGGLTRIDFDEDGIYEITLANYDDIFGFATAFRPSNSIIFQYDKKLRKFLPASHKLQEYTLENIEEQIQKFKADEKKEFSDVLEITFRYFYAGKEEEGWKFFDENFLPDKNTYTIKVEDKEKAREEIKNALNENLVYQFIKKDLEKSVK